MTHVIIQSLAKRSLRPVPELKPGYTVRVHEKIREGEKERVQMFEGLVISVHRGHVPTDSTFTVRKVVSGIGVEKQFPLLSPMLEKIEVKKVAKVRRAKLFFVRGRSGKSARMTERFTMEGEFVVESGAPTEQVTDQSAPAAEVAVAA